MYRCNRLSQQELQDAHIHDHVPLVLVQPTDLFCFLLVGGWGGEVKAGSYSDIQKMKHYDLVDLVPYTHQVLENHVHACNSR